MIRSLRANREGLAGSCVDQGFIQFAPRLCRACEQVIALMEQHSPSSSSGWNVRQVDLSGGEQISAATFYFHARQHCCQFGPLASCCRWWAVDALVSVSIYLRT